MTWWTRWFPFLQWQRPDVRVLRVEAMAGLTVAMVLIPQSVAYAALAGMPLVTGLYAALLPALVAVLWGGTNRLSVGPTALTCLLIAASLHGMAPVGSAQWVVLAVWLALLSGGLQLILGLGQWAWLLNVVSSPVLVGFTQAAGLLIIASQLPALLGLHGALGEALSTPWNLAELAFGAGSLALLWAAKSWLPRLPAILLLIVLSALLSQALRFAGNANAVIGALPGGFPVLSLPGVVPWDLLGKLFVPAMVIALVSFLETASSAKLQCQHDGARWNDNQDLIGQGLAKIASALSGSFATSTSFSRSAISTYAGARTGWSGVITVLLVLLCLVFLMPALHHVPKAVLAAVVIMAVAGLVQPWQFARVWRISRAEGLTALATFAITLLSSPRIYWGVLAGVVLGLVHFLYLRLHPRIIEVGLHPDGSLRDRHLWKLPPLADHLYALRMDAELDFAAASSFERNLVEYLNANPETRHVCLFAQPINRLDSTGAEVFANLLNLLQARNITLHISGIKLPVETVLRRSGLLHDQAGVELYRTDAEALLRIAALS